MHRDRLDDGVSFVEATIVMCVSGIILALALPLTARTVDEGRARNAAAFVAARLREVRQQAAMRTTSTGLVFDRVGTRWLFTVCRDGNANGIRRAEIRSGRDLCAGSPTDLTDLFPSVSIESDASIRGPEGDPPSSDPVRFGSSNIASFSASGSCTAGSLFLRSARGARYAVRIAGVTGRLRIFRYDEGARLWREQ